MRSGNFSGMNVLVMGLGLHGGGAESARHLAGLGANVTVTDLRDERILAPSIEKLESFKIRYVLGRHEMADFQNADIVIKNPGVRPDSPYLKSARRIETDISLFLASCPARLSAVTGTKGKSTASSALHWVLNESRTTAAAPLAGRSRLGGNITVSPLSFLDELEAGDDVVLELSSFQLGDLRGRGLLKPRAAAITCILRDHLDRYGTMEAYVNDKRIIYHDQDDRDITVAGTDEWGRSFHRESRARRITFSQEPLGDGITGGWIADPAGPAFARLWEIPDESYAFAKSCAFIKSGAFARNAAAGSIVEIVPDRPLIPGYHQKRNLLAAALALLDLGIPAEFIRESLGRFPGVEHRLEFFHEAGGIRFYNDSAATIPEAAASAVRAFEKPPVFVAGGADKDLDFTLLAQAAQNAKAVILLAGTGTVKITALLDSARVKYRGPFDSPEAAAEAALQAAAPGDTVLLSPGCASFGMFLNEFDRGRKWKEAVRRLAQ
ncbi:MAG: UDP-N-acetylmuramoyl-L-alanine--D-glutamate ligase [Treponema sp.]|nr:UDP-N-acetylmuramoyl-L-alanine--D-glutamate ligase [Treponema sp.]